jgi:hypothetical protein
MHGPFIVAQQARGLLQDLTRVISPQQLDVAGWSMPQASHERPRNPQVVKVGRGWQTSVQIWQRHPKAAAVRARTG